MILALSLFLSPALAQENPQPTRIEYRKETILEFGKEVKVEGGVEHPTGVGVFEARRGQFKPLIHLRADFADEMTRSVDEAR